MEHCSHPAPHPGSGIRPVESIQAVHDDASAPATTSRGTGQFVTGGLLSTEPDEVNNNDQDGHKDGPASPVSSESSGEDYQESQSITGSVGASCVQRQPGLVETAPSGDVAFYLNPNSSSLPVRESTVAAAATGIFSKSPRYTPDMIWQASRRLFWPRMPAPMRGRSELDMWRMVCGTVCQFCSLRDENTKLRSIKDPWHRGPGARGVSTIFTFGIVSCGLCLMKKGLKAIQGDREPTRRQLMKLYWHDQVKAINADFDSAQSLGPAVAEEWLKGVAILGERARADASRWERWEASGELRRTLLHFDVDKASPAKDVEHGQKPAGQSTPKPRGSSALGPGNTASKKNNSDEEWDGAQGPLRARISAYADEVIKHGWNEGQRVTKSLSPLFSSSVLLHVRQQFYADVERERQEAIAAGRQPAVDRLGKPWTQKLTLENMKWIYDVKIKPHVVRHGPAMFLCNGCSPPTPKYYGFQAIIQHYAAKHTNALSLGHIVVNWRAEWPLVPPFKPISEEATCAPGTTAAGADRRWPYTRSTHPQTYYPTYTGDGGSGYHQASVPASGNRNTNQLSPHSMAVQVQREPVGPSAWGPAPMPESAYNARLKFMARIAGQTWNVISRVEGIDKAVTLCVTVHHIAKGFQIEYSESAPLQMFIHGLLSCAEMKPIGSSIQGLACKPCAEDVLVNLQPRPCSAIQLAIHFRDAHVENTNAPPLDWRTQMILLPEMHVLATLPRLLAYDRVAYNTVADALPWAFDDNIHGSMYLDRQPYLGGVGHHQDYQLSGVRDLERRGGGMYYIQRSVHQGGVLQGLEEYNPARARVD
ncbi:hypothetical protein GMORB2_6869 [Geosmithia morbida]|uniref:DUF7892 domain-containing protein n=1 Tax=Geosmithia morbida TaxID=1094350 RepID=A0A9P4YVQ2_9HYPO|nr:uncharacterized protein GMORB2_6869 [Geosmithia morbida]KAF4122563.1 hypothetical protein GMORB2_6869 [Geosmithia morbida]